MAQSGKEAELVVLLGTPNPESSRLYGITVTQGDPSWAGPLAGLPLNLPVYHVTRSPRSKTRSPPKSTTTTSAWPNSPWMWMPSPPPSVKSAPMPASSLSRC